MSRTGKAVLFVWLWLIFGVFNYGATLAYFQGQYPIIAARYYRDDVYFSLFMAISGPLGTIPTLATSHYLKFGWRIK